MEEGREVKRSVTENRSTKAPQAKNFYLETTNAVYF